MMARWYHRGRTPTPVEIPGRGSVVIARGTTFEAPEGSVHHLLSAGLVVRMPDLAPAAPAVPAPETAKVEEGSMDPLPFPNPVAEESAKAAEEVIETPPESTVSEESVVESPESSQDEVVEEAVREEAQVSNPVKEKQTPKASRKKDREQGT